MEDEMEEFQRAEMLLGEANIKKLSKLHIAVFGVGGVGGYVVEALIRTGIGAFDLIDNDVVSISNLNRQIIATHDTIGKSKTQVMKERILSINPNAKVTVHNCFFLPDNKDSIDFTQYDYVVDAVDTVTAKIAIIECSKEANVPVISSMGTGNKTHPELFQIADISKTSVCPLARVMRYELKKRRIEKVKVLYSKETPIKPTESKEQERPVPGSVAFCPSVAGLLIASEIIHHFC